MIGLFEGWRKRFEADLRALEGRPSLLAVSFGAPAFDAAKSSPSVIIEPKKKLGRGVNWNYYLDRPFPVFLNPPALPPSAAELEAALARRERVRVSHWRLRKLGRG